MDKLDKETRKRVSKAGGHGRKAKLTPKQRTEIAQKAAAARWKLAAQRD